MWNLLPVLEYAKTFDFEKTDLSFDKDPILENVPYDADQNRPDDGLDNPLYVSTLGS